ncbi:MAG: branched-chain amino acid transport system ATP-binding protein [Paracoccaceae bacterium]|jgi:branched-chain amino acid transport system ATP-binding protein
MCCQTARLFRLIWGMMMLEVRELSATYGKHRALDGVSLRVDPGEIVVILEANGAGKSTLLKAIGGICVGAVSGHVVIDGHPILAASPDAIVAHGLALVPEGRGIFGDLSVRENLTLGADANRARADEAANLDRVLTLFPRLGERQRQIARTMSGGE